VHQNSHDPAIRPETLAALASEIAGRAVPLDVARDHAAAMNEFLPHIEALRALPIKDLTPPLAFTPEEDWA